jgi:WD40 repeat protein
MKTNNPFPGIRPFQVDEEKFFFGRHNHVHSCLSTLSHERTLAVIGTSGSGKSSLINAGLIPAIKNGGVLPALQAYPKRSDQHDYDKGLPFHDGLSLVSSDAIEVPAGFDLTPAKHTRRLEIVRITPGSQPLRSLIQSLSGSLQNAPDGEVRTQVLLNRYTGISGDDLLDELAWDQNTDLVLIVDQMEELFFGTQAAASGNLQAGIADLNRMNAADAFVSAVDAIASCNRHQTWLIIGMRADFLAETATYPCLAERIARSMYIIPALTDSEIEESIVRPVAVLLSELPKIACEPLEPGHTAAQEVSSSQKEDGTGQARTPPPQFPRATCIKLMNLLQVGKTWEDRLPLLQHFLSLAFNESQRPEKPFDLGTFVQQIEDYIQQFPSDTYGDALNFHGKELLRKAGELGATQRQTLLFFSHLIHVDESHRVIRRTVNRVVFDANPSIGSKATEALLSALGGLFPGWLIQQKGSDDITISHEALLRNWSIFNEPKGWPVDQFQEKNPEFVVPDRLAGLSIRALRLAQTLQELHIRKTEHGKFDYLNEEPARFSQPWFRELWQALAGHPPQLISLSRQRSLEQACRPHGDAPESIWLSVWHSQKQEWTVSLVEKAIHRNNALMLRHRMQASLLLILFFSLVFGTGSLILQIQNAKLEAAELEKKNAATELEKQKAATELEKQKAATELEKQKAATELEKQKAATELEKQKVATEKQAKAELELKAKEQLAALNLKMRDEKQQEAQVWEQTLAELKDDFDQLREIWKKKGEVPPPSNSGMGIVVINVSDKLDRPDRILLPEMQDKRQKIPGGLKSIVGVSNNSSLSSETAAGGAEVGNQVSSFRLMTNSILYGAVQTPNAAFREVGLAWSKETGLHIVDANGNLLVGLKSHLSMPPLDASGAARPDTNELMLSAIYSDGTTIFWECNLGTENPLSSSSSPPKKARQIDPSRTRTCPEGWQTPQPGKTLDIVELRDSSMLISSKGDFFYARREAASWDRLILESSMSDSGTNALCVPIREQNLYFVARGNLASIIGNGKPRVNWKCDFPEVEIRRIAAQYINEQLWFAIGLSNGHTFVKGCHQDSLQPTEAIQSWSTSDQGIILLDDADIPVSSLAFAPTKDSLAVGYDDGSVRAWRHLTNRIHGKKDTPLVSKARNYGAASESIASVTALRFSQNSEQLVGLRANGDIVQIPLVIRVKGKPRQMSDKEQRTDQKWALYPNNALLEGLRKQGLLEGNVIADNALFITSRWDYTFTSSDLLRSKEVTIRAVFPDGAVQSLRARPLDYGPDASSDNSFILSPAVFKRLGVALTPNGNPKDKGITFEIEFEPFRESTRP